MDILLLMQIISRLLSKKYGREISMKAIPVQKDS